MTDQTEMQIPDDVMEAAHLAFDIAYHAEDDVERYAVIARAILAERERCARIASGCSCDAQFLIRDWAPMTEDKSAEIKAGAQSMFDYIRHVDK